MLVRKPRPKHCCHVHCALCVVAEDTTPDEVSEVLGLRRDGGHVLAREIADMSVVAEGPVCTWIIKSRDDPHAPAAQHISGLLALLNPKKEEFHALMQRGAIADIRLGILGTGLAIPFELPPDVSRGIAELNIGLVVDFTSEEEWRKTISDLDNGE